MKRIIKLIVFVMLLLTVFSFNILGETNDFTITISKKTMSLDYFNNNENKEEIIKLIKQSNGTFLVQSSECLYLGQISVEENEIKVSDKISKFEYPKEKFNGYKNPLKNENFISTKIEQATIGTLIQVDKKSSELKNAYYYQVYDNGKAISQKTKPNHSTTMYPAKKPGDSIDVKFFDKKKNEIKTVTDIIIGEDYIYKRNISGVINLLEDEKNKNTATKIIICCIKSDELGESQYPVVESKHITIPRGESSANYSFELPRDKNYIIQYEIMDKKTNFIPRGYYNRSGVEYDKNYAEVLYLGDENIDNVDFTIKPCKTISGKLIVNNGVTIPKGGLHAYITACIKRDSDNNDYFEYIDQDYVTIPAGQSFTNFSLDVKENENYIISYYFVEDDIKDIDFTIENSVPINGKINFSDDYIKSNNVKYVEINVYKKVGASYGIIESSKVYVSPYENSYNIKMNVLKNGEYKIKYNVYNTNQQCIEENFLGKDGVIGDRYSVQWMKLNLENTININLSE